MRIIIEDSTGPAPQVSVMPQGAGATATTSDPLDGGQPSEELLTAFGAAAPQDSRDEKRSADAGTPPSWLVEVIEGGASH